MTERLAKAIFAAAVVVVAATVLLLSMLDGGKPARHHTAAVPPVTTPAPGDLAARLEQQQQQQIDRAAASAGPPARHAAAVPDSVLDARAKAPALRTAHLFMRAYLRYDVGHVDAGVKTTFARTATRLLAKQLLSAPPNIPPTLSHQPRAVPPERLGYLDGQLGSDRRAMTATATLLSGPDSSSIELRLIRRGSRWLVAAVVV
jgi:cell division septation protein DedD